MNYVLMKVLNKNFDFKKIYKNIFEIKKINIFYKNLLF